MDREKTMTLVLLDLCAFACAQSKANGARRDFETAFRLAEAHSLPEADLYRDFVDRLENETDNQAAVEPAFQAL